MHHTEAERFDQAASALGRTSQGLFCAVGERDKALASEIRLRAGAPAVLSLPSGRLCVGTSPLTPGNIEEMVLSLCGHSVYSHQHEMAGGYISVPGGHRAGVCGRAVVSDGKITSVTDVSSICLRIAREHPGCAAGLCERLFAAGAANVVLAGAPGSGKTTMLRDMACMLAERLRLNVAVVDERGELAPGVPGKPGRVDRLCDVLRGYPKAEGITQALRSLAPDVIICDELGGENDLAAVRSGINAGVKIICSVHAGSAHELAARPVTAGLLGTGAFERFVVLSGRSSPGEVMMIMNGNEMYEMACCSADNDMLAACRKRAG